MSPFERKIVHDAVAAAGLRSESEGEEPNRRVVVFPPGDARPVVPGDLSDVSAVPEGTAVGPWPDLKAGPVPGSAASVFGPALPAAVAYAGSSPPAAWSRACSARGRCPGCGTGTC